MKITKKFLLVFTVIILATAKTSMAIEVPALTPSVSPNEIIIYTVPTHDSYNCNNNSSGADTTITTPSLSCPAGYGGSDPTVIKTRPLVISFLPGSSPLTKAEAGIYYTGSSTQWLVKGWCDPSGTFTMMIQFYCVKT
jgi:hypothetical protein